MLIVRIIATVAALLFGLFLASCFGLAFNGSPGALWPMLSLQAVALAITASLLWFVWRFKL